MLIQFILEYCLLEKFGLEGTSSEFVIALF